MIDKSRALVVGLIVFAVASGHAQTPGSSGSGVRVWEEPITLPTYLMGADDVNPIFERPLSYQGAHRVLYPYPVQDNFTHQRADRSYQALFLENEYIKLCVVPDLGGRLFYATDKTNGYEMFYRQHVIKPAHIGMLGAWISGGIEWCVFHHHRASSFMPVDNLMQENADGSKTIWIGEIEPRHRMNWSIGITLHPGQALIQADIKMFNRTGTENSILYWANVATHANDDYQVIFPPSVEYGVYHAKNSFIHWPVGRGEYVGKDYTGVDASWWKNHPESISIFAHDLEEGFLAGYDHGQKAGTLHIANPHIVAGAKLWEWGPGAHGSMWDTRVLTDSDGPYAELMAGAYSDNQPDYSWIAPYEAKLATQYWMPLRDIGGVNAATVEASLNLDVRNGEVFLGINTTAPYRNAVISLDGAKPIVEMTQDIAPDIPFTHRCRLPADEEPENLRATLRTGDGRLLVQYLNRTNEVPDQLPETVEPPPKPEEIKTVEELYLTGLRIKQFHNAQLNPNDYFDEALKRDPGDVRSNIQLGLDAAGKWMFAEAAERFQAAINRISRGYTRPQDCEAYYQLGITQLRQGNLETAYDHLYRAAWDSNHRGAAYYNLAAIDSLRGEYGAALANLDQALTMNAQNAQALGLKSAVLRRSGRAEEALTAAEKVLEINPLNHLALHECVQSLMVLAREAAAGEAWTTYEKVMRDYPESYVELATDYMQFGLWDNAIAALERPVGKPEQRTADYAMVHYYLAYLYGRILDRPSQEASLARASRSSTDYVFPFRFEDLTVLNEATQHAPGDSRAHYYLGNLLFDRQPEQAIECWKTSVSLEPELAIAYRNLGWAYAYGFNDLEQAIAQYEQAIEQNAADPRYFYELDVIQEQTGTPIEQRLALLEGHHSVVEQHNLALVREIIALVQGGKYDKAIGYLSDYDFPVQEGSDRLHDMYVDAHLLRGLDHYNASAYPLALDDFRAADDYPENHQIGRNERYAKNAEIYYFTGLACKALEQTDQAKQWFERASRAGEGRRSRSGRPSTYYRALALAELGQSDKASELLNQLIEQGRENLEMASEVDFFAKFGEGEPLHMRQANAYYLIGLGRLGLGERASAREAFTQAIELDGNHIWARSHLSELSNEG